MDNKRIALILPCKNEESSVRKVIMDWKAVLPEDARVYLCDNNCTDKSAEIAEACGAVVLKETEPGKGCAVKCLLNHVDADVYIMTDVDDTYPATMDVVTPVLEGKYDICIGDRMSCGSKFDKQSSRIKHIGNKMFFGMCRLFLGKEIKDPLSGLRVFTKQFIVGLQLSDGFEIEMEMNKHIAKKKFRVLYVPIDYKTRHGDEKSKISVFGDGWKIMKTMLKR